MPESYIITRIAPIILNERTTPVFSTMLLCQHSRFISRLFVLLVFVAALLIYFHRHNNKKIISEPLVFNKPMGRVEPMKSLDNNFSVATVPAKISNALRFGDGSAKIKLAVVICGNVLNQTIVTLKSAVVLTKSPLHLIVVSDKENQEKVKNGVLAWPHSILSKLSLEIHPIAFPDDKYGNQWRKVFKLCACQRLFLPSLLGHIDSLIYVDTDTIFMHPIEKLWQYFEKMNDNQIAGLAPEHEDFATGWYNRFAKHPFFKPLGVNSGVMLMNLTRMRSFKWQSYLQPILTEYKMKIVWGDQDIINIIFSFHSEKLLIFPCEWNFRPDHCMYSSVCKTIEEDGVKVIHGNRGVYHNDKQPVFKAIYQAMENYEVGSEIITGLLEPLKNSITKDTNTNCGKISHTLVKGLEKSITYLNSESKNR